MLAIVLHMTDAEIDADLPTVEDMANNLQLWRSVVKRMQLRIREAEAMVADEVVPSVDPVLIKANLPTPQDAAGWVDEWEVLGTAIEDLVRRTNRHLRSEDTRDMDGYEWHAGTDSDDEGAQQCAVEGCKHTARAYYVKAEEVDDADGEWVEHEHWCADHFGDRDIYRAVEARHKLETLQELLERSKDDEEWYSPGERWGMGGAFMACMRGRACPRLKSAAMSVDRRWTMRHTEDSYTLCTPCWRSPDRVEYVRTQYNKEHQ